MTDQKALNEIRDMLAGPKIGEAWLKEDAEQIAHVRQYVTAAQIYVQLATKIANLECLKDALRELNDHIDDGRAALDMLPDLIDEARRDTAEANSQFGVGA